MPIFKIDSHMDKHPVLLVIDKWWIILIRNGFNRIAKINLGDFSQSGCLFWFFIFIFSIQWRLIVTIGHSIKITQTGCIPLTIKIDTLCSNAEKLALDSWSRIRRGQTYAVTSCSGTRGPSKTSALVTCCITSCDVHQGPEMPGEEKEVAWRPSHLWSEARKTGLSWAEPGPGPESGALGMEMCAGQP